MDEKLLYHIWDAGHLKGDLHTVSGKALVIKYQGQYNTFRGPDFINCFINLDGVEFRGDIEIHVTTQDWLKHSHHEDQFYNNVILHVVLNHNEVGNVTIKEDGKFVEILELDSQLSDDVQKLIANPPKERVQTKACYCNLLSAIDNDRLVSILSYHGKQRFHGKVRRFNASLNLSDFDQVLYEGMMEAAGYDKNKLNLLQLAQRIPLAYFKDWYSNGMSGLQMLSIMIGNSGLLDISRTRLPESLFSELVNAFEGQAYFARKIHLDWQLFRIRPTNHPVLRLCSLVDFLYNRLQGGLLNFFIQEIELSKPNAKERYSIFKRVLSSPKPFGLPGNGLGPSVVSNIYYNIYLPVMYLYAQKVADANLEKSLLDSWIDFDALQDNFITRFMSRQVNPGQVSLANSKSLFQQGLMNIFYRTCKYNLCDECVESSRHYG